MLGPRPPLPEGWQSLKVYCGVALREDEELRSLRAATCAALDLVPRAEAHVTVAYLGQVTEPELEELRRELAPLMDDDLASFHVAGTGAAFEPELGKPELLQSGALERAIPHACVAWWTLSPHGVLYRLREATATLLASWGRPLPESEPYAPHVTLGARGRPGTPHDDFDVFTLEKSASLQAFAAPSRVRSARLHFTARKILPESVLCLRAW